MVWLWDAGDWLSVLQSVGAPRSCTGPRRTLTSTTRSHTSTWRSPATRGTSPVTTAPVSWLLEFLNVDIDAFGNPLLHYGSLKESNLRKSCRSILLRVLYFKLCSWGFSKLSLSKWMNFIICSENLREVTVCWLQGWRARPRCWCARCGGGATAWCPGSAAARTQSCSAPAPSPSPPTRAWPSPTRPAPRTGCWASPGRGWGTAATTSARSTPSPRSTSASGSTSSVSPH